MVEAADDPRVIYAERSDYMCDIAEERCYLFFPDEKVKVLSDYGHLTMDGARVLGRIASERRWLADFLTPEAGH